MNTLKTGLKNRIGGYDRVMTTHGINISQLKSIQSQINEATKGLLRQSERLQHNVGELIRRQYNLGIVDEMILRNDAWIMLADGWNAYPILRDDFKDVFQAKAQKGSVLPNHMHKQVETIYVVHGKITLRIEGSDDAYVVLEDNESYVIPQHVPHECTANKDTTMIITFQPPITKMI
jgi:mannose-6-phosphate isomerase-like protein (cupin superfamily)